MIPETEFLCWNNGETFKIKMPRHFRSMEMTCWSCNCYHRVVAIATWFNGRRVAS
jgi:hypothetical protein